MTLDVELTKNDSLKCLFLKSFSKATIWVFDRFIRCSNSNACLASALFRMKIFYIVNMFFLACIGWPFCFAKVLLVTVTTRYAIYRALTIKRVDRIFSISQLVTNFPIHLKNELILWSLRHLWSFCLSRRSLLRTVWWLRPKVLWRNKRSFNTHKKEHINYIKHLHPKKRALAKHGLELEHRMNWSKTQIVVFVNDFRKRRFIES